LSFLNSQKKQKYLKVLRQRDLVKRRGRTGTTVPETQVSIKEGKRGRMFKGKFGKVTGLDIGDVKKRSIGQIRSWGGQRENHKEKRGCKKKPKALCCPR